jgi:hypothetical protein
VDYMGTKMNAFMNDDVTLIYCGRYQTTITIQTVLE